MRRRNIVCALLLFLIMLLIVGIGVGGAVVGKIFGSNAQAVIDAYPIASPSPTSTKTLSDVPSIDGQNSSDLNDRVSSSIPTTRSTSVKSTQHPTSSPSLGTKSASSVQPSFSTSLKPTLASSVRPSNSPSELPSLTSSEPSSLQPDISGSAQPSQFSRNQLSLSPSLRPTFSALRISMNSLAKNLSLSIPSNSKAPLFRALAWAAEQKASPTAQRVGLATLFYSTRGEEWINQYSFLSETSECLWSELNGEQFQGVLCHSDGSVGALFLSGNGLSGSLPSEVVLLPNLVMLWIEDNNMTGSIPTEISYLHRLVRIEATNNQLTGRIPSEFGLMTSLERINLRNNLLSGLVPSDELATLPLLGSLQIDRNVLVGNLTSICDTHAELVLTADCQETVCPCCFVCCDPADACEMTN